MQQMPPSSAHQANVGIPGGFNPRQAMTFQSLQGSTPFSSQQAARYPNPENAPVSTSAGNQASKALPVPPMPPVVSTQAAINQAQSSTSASTAVRYAEFYKIFDFLF